MHCFYITSIVEYNGWTWIQIKQTNMAPGYTKFWWASGGNPAQS